MYWYTDEQRTAARAKIPPETEDFISSPSYVRIFSGIRKKNNLAISELMEVSEVAFITLIGLETAEKLETNIHQHVPTLTNEQAQSVVGDIRSRILAENDRRVKEHLFEDAWDESELGPKRAQPWRANESVPSDEDLDALEHEERERTASIATLVLQELATLKNS